MQQVQLSLDLAAAVAAVYERAAYAAQIDYQPPPPPPPLGPQEAEWVERLLRSYQEPQGDSLG